MDFPNATSLTETATRKSSLNILVVDDEELLCEIVKEFLTADGHSVVTATNGQEGLAKFREGKFDMVLSDRAMPKMGGDELANSVKLLSPNTAFVMVTAYGYSMNAAGTKPRGVDKIVSKPFTTAELRDVLNWYAARPT